VLLALSTIGWKIPKDYVYDEWIPILARYVYTNVSDLIIYNANGFGILFSAVVQYIPI